MTYQGCQIVVVDNGYEIKDPKDGQRNKVTHGIMVNDGGGKIYMTKPDYDNLERQCDENSSAMWPRPAQIGDE